jgi:hypothetical protein
MLLLVHVYRCLSLGLARPLVHVLLLESRLGQTVRRLTWMPPTLSDYFAHASKKAPIQSVIIHPCIFGFVLEAAFKPSTSQAQVKHKSSTVVASQAQVKHESSTSQAQVKHSRHKSSTSQAQVKHESCTSQAQVKHIRHKSSTSQAQDQHKLSISGTIHTQAKHETSHEHEAQVKHESSTSPAH